VRGAGQRPEDAGCVPDARSVDQTGTTSKPGEWGLTGLATVVLAPVRAQIEVAADAASFTRIEAAALTKVWASSSVEP
jgi:hypothetical protein